MMLILTTDEVRKALYLDDDADDEDLEHYSEVASVYIEQKTGFNFASEVKVHPLAKQAAILYVRQLYYTGEKYDPKHDYAIGLSSLIQDLQVIANDKK